MRNGELTTPDDATIVKVHELVNVWIVCPQIVVIVPPVEVGDTPSEPSVAYETITTPLHPTSPVVFTDAPDHHPVLAVPLVPTPVTPQYPAPHHPAPPAPPVTPADPPHHHPYVTDAPDIELAVPAHPAAPILYDIPAHQFAESPAPPAPPVVDVHPEKLPLQLFHHFVVVPENTVAHFHQIPVSQLNVESCQFAPFALFAPAPPAPIVTVYDQGVIEREALYVTCQPPHQEL